MLQKKHWKLVKPGIVRKQEEVSTKSYSVMDTPNASTIETVVEIELPPSHKTIKAVVSPLMVKWY